MDFITKNPGLQHISEKILMNLNHQDLMMCREVNQSWEQILDKNPVFWLNKCSVYVYDGPDEAYKLQWNALIQASNSNQKEKIVQHLMDIHQNVAQGGRIDVQIGK